MSIDVLFLGGTSVDLIPKSRGSASAFFTASVGGGITNSAIIAAKLGLKAAMLSKIGRDLLGDFAVSQLKGSGVNTAGIIRDPGIRTPIAIANIDKNGNSIYTFYKNSAKESIVPLKTVPKNLLKNCGIFHFGSGFSYQKETSIEALKYVKYLKKRGAFISFDPNIRPYAIKDKKGAKDRVLRLLKWADLLRLSEIDLEFLTGWKDPKKGLKKLKKVTKAKTILTLGAKGSLHLDNDDNFIKIPAFKIKAADTIGAGDSYTAGILYKISKIGEERVFSDIKPAMTFASALAALICAKSGANQGLKGIKQVISFLKKH